MKKGIILLGSSNSNGETAQVAQFLQQQTGFDLVDLQPLNIGHFDYEFNNQHDDFLPLLRRIVNNYDGIIFATPVYWYTMSGITKVFLDRLADVLQLENERATGRELRGMQLAVISCGYDSTVKTGFAMPFIESAKYLGMTYVGDLHTYLQEKPLMGEMRHRIQQFSESISNFNV